MAEFSFKNPTNLGVVLCMTTDFTYELNIESYTDLGIRIA